MGFCENCLNFEVCLQSYEDEPTNGYQQAPTRIGNFSESWDEYGLGGGNEDETALCDYKKEISKGLGSDFINLEPPHICPVAEDHKPLTGYALEVEASPVTDYFKSSRRNSLGDSKSASSCNRCRPAVITKETENNAARNNRLSNTIVPLTDSHLATQSQPKSRGVISWLFPRLKKKNKNENYSPNRTESEDVSQIFKDLGIVSIETLKKELMEANERRDAALMEVSEMKSCLGELRQKLEGLEGYCEELKTALNQATLTRDFQTTNNLPKKNNQMPVSEEVMVEGFLQIVSEARLSVKQFCKTLVTQIEETDSTLMENLNSLLQPYKLSLNSKYSRPVLYHLEAIINQALYQDFENCVFQKNGSPKLLDPQEDRQAQFSSFVALRNLSWNQVLGKGTKYYSQEFSKFCDQKMSCIISTLNWTRPWPEQLLQAFFVAAKCIWLLHLLAFSFHPPLKILRVEENRSFDSSYMEDVFAERQRNGPSRVKIMVMPGFYVQDRILRCKVVCRYKSPA